MVRIGRPWTEFERESVIGNGRAEFAAAGRRLLRWGMQHGAGIRVDGPAQITEGVRAVLRLRIGPLLIAAPVEVLGVITEDRAIAFTYRALPGHPEEGEEEFRVEHRADDSVVAMIRACARPATWWSRLGGPVTRLLQRRFTERYLRALTDDATSTDALT